MTSKSKFRIKNILSFKCVTRVYKVIIYLSTFWQLTLTTFYLYIVEYNENVYDGYSDNIMLETKKTNLKVQNDGPNKAECEFRISVNDILATNINLEKKSHFGAIYWTIIKVRLRPEGSYF